MKRIVRILCLCLLGVTLGFADDTNLTLTIEGITYHNVRFVHPTPATVTIFHSTGVATIPLAKLPPALQKQFGYDPQAAAQWQAEQQKRDAEAADAQRERTARWQAEQDKAAAETAAASAAAAEARRKLASAVQWTLKVQSVLPDAVIAWGCPGARPNCPDSKAILLVDPPGLRSLAEGEQITATAYRDGNAQAQTRTLEKWVCIGDGSPFSQAAPQIQQPPQPAATGADTVFPDLHNTGAFGFPQREALVLRDRPALRFSVWNNDQYLFAQAELWTDNESSVGKDANGDPIGDYSELMLDLNDDGKETPDVDRVYRLNQRPYLPGMHYAICKGNRGTSPDRSDSAGRGAIRYVRGDMPNRVRVDTYLIPLQEISRRVGDRIGICFYAFSPKQNLLVNSVTFDNFIPYNKYTEYVLTQGRPIDLSQVPEGREDKLPAQ
ncbi:MAG TPA: hypothetical protein VMP11_19900 [Verrucomicrobiae bacterium]|nr:hypothetical protein [Verrucomicrobiae bacterium]